MRPAEPPGGVPGGYPHAFTESTLTVLHCSLPRPTRLPMPNQADVVRARRPPRRLARHPARRRLVPDERSAEAWHPCALQGRAATPFRGFFGVVVQDGLHVKSAVGARRLTTGTLVERERNAQPAAGGRRERDQRPRPLLVAFGLLRRPASATPGEAQASPERWCVEAADRRRGTTNRRVEPTRSVASMEAASRRSVDSPALDAGRADASLVFSWPSGPPPAAHPRGRSRMPTPRRPSDGPIIVRSRLLRCQTVDRLRDSIPQPYRSNRSSRVG